MKPNLILVDLRMPGLGGVEVCKRLRAAGMQTPLIVLSAIGEEVETLWLSDTIRESRPTVLDEVRQGLGMVEGSLIEQCSPAGMGAQSQHCQE